MEKDFWMKAAAICFGLWAAVVGYSSKLIVSMVQKEADEAHEYREYMSGRLSTIETRQAYVMQEIRDCKERKYRESTVGRSAAPSASTP